MVCGSWNAGVEVQGDHHWKGIAGCSLHQLNTQQWGILDKRQVCQQNVGVNHRLALSLGWVGGDENKPGGPGLELVVLPVAPFAILTRPGFGALRAIMESNCVINPGQQHVPSRTR